eukprot:TRINITY_DN8068_c0_g2_i4.p1 TRINITY_DN8068_c0_g2~~TRINITY_DN8068_c0_g2_i4.p1  ORF type:complete len:186 (-),score=41.50 TRINITY_DN8068_c0_g2_i4:82-639(-)
MMDFCGTTEYLAPEIIRGKGYGKEVDWWAFGTLIYEMLTALTPFQSTKKEELFSMILLDPVKLPRYFSPELKSLLAGLFQKSPSKRLGSAEIRSHPWFADINWDSLLQKKIKAPFRPKLKDELDLSNFSEEFTLMEINSHQEIIMQRPFTVESFSWEKQRIIESETNERSSIENSRTCHYLVHAV